MAKLMNRYTASSEDIGRDARGDPLRGLLRRIPRQVRVARRSSNLFVAQQTPDHGKGLAQGQGAAGVRMTEVVDPDIMKSSARPDDLQASSIWRRCVPGFLPGMTQGFPSMRGKEARSSTARGGAGPPARPSWRRAA